MRNPPGIKWFLLGTQFWCSLSRSSLIKIALLVRMHPIRYSYFASLIFILIQYSAVQLYVQAVCMFQTHSEVYVSNLAYIYGRAKFQNTFQRRITILSGRALSSFHRLPCYFIWVSYSKRERDLGQIFSWVLLQVGVYISNTCMLQVKQPLHGRRSCKSLTASCPFIFSADDEINEASSSSSINNLVIISQPLQAFPNLVNVLEPSSSGINSNHPGLQKKQYCFAHGVCVLSLERHMYASAEAVPVRWMDPSSEFYSEASQREGSGDGWRGRGALGIQNDDELIPTATSN